MVCEVTGVTVAESSIPLGAVQASLTQPTSSASQPHSDRVRRVSRHPGLQQPQHVGDSEPAAVRFVMYDRVTAEHKH